MERMLLKIRELEREAQILIEKELGSDNIPSPLQRPQPQPQPQPCKNLPVQKEPRFSPSLSIAANPIEVALEESNRTPKQLQRKCKEVVQQEPRIPPRVSTAVKSNIVALEDGNQTPKSSTSQEPLASRDGDWVREMKEEAGRWTGNQLVVLSLFDGIGGVWAALTRLGIPYRGYSSEVSAPAVEVVRTKFPEVQHLGDVRKLERKDIKEDVDLLVGGFPCQDLSCMGKREGLHGQRSRLFFDLLEAMKVFQPKWFLVENVASMTWIDRLEISKYTGVRPLELDSIELTPTRRRRLYWTNIPHPPKLPSVRNHPSTLVQSCLQNAIALEEKTGVILSNTSDSSNSYSLEKAYVNEFEGFREIGQAEVDCLLGFLPHHTAVILSTNSTENNCCQLELVMENDGSHRLRYLRPHELELLMGFPAHHTGVLVHEGTNSLTSTLVARKITKAKSSKAAAKRRARKAAGGEKEFRREPLRATVRWLLLGNTFSVQVIAYLLSPLLKKSVRDLGQPIHSSRSTLEKECAVMEVGDVWALYNEQERPNWYALIVNRTGDRFSDPKLAPSAKTTKKFPLQVELKYLEITPAYSWDEEDKWNPLRGTGLYEARREVDIQDSWTAFSHRVTSIIRMSNKVFIFPGKNELWTVYCQRIWSPFFVYVMESTINISTLSSVRPNAEGFSARCYLVIKTGEHETYRRTEKVLELEDLSMFCFQVPYSFKQQADLLKVEIGTGGRRSKKIERHIRKMRKRKRKEESSSVEAQKGEKLGVVVEETFHEEEEEVVVVDAPPNPVPEEEEQECVLEVDLRCHCRRTRREESESEVDTSAGEVIIIDDDDDDVDDE